MTYTDLFNSIPNLSAISRLLTGSLVTGRRYCCCTGFRRPI